MNKNKTIIICLAIIIFAAAYVVVQKSAASFTIHFYGEHEHSGGSESWDGTAVYSNGQLVDGKEVSTSGAGGGCTQNCDYTQTCVFSNGVWHDVNTTNVCTPYIYGILDKLPGGVFEMGGITFPTNKTEFEKLVEDRALIQKSQDQCGNQQTCFEFVR